ncbi:hypothetical protein Barb7_02834 [Bacteroidales bacterium Barb7]|nr:hypothetical protein Barb7_02834 [Bacteroidales bacterium Barb7]
MIWILLKRVFVVILLTGLFPVLRAQEYKYEIGGAAGTSIYMGDANKTALTKGASPSFGAVVRLNTNFRWAMKGNLMWGQVSGTTVGLENVFPNGEAFSFSRNWIELGGQAEFNFFPYSDKFAYANARRFTPYILAGAGMTVAPGGNNGTLMTLNIPLGFGVKYKLKNRINLSCEYAFRKLFGDGLEGNASLEDPYGIKSSLLKNKDWYSCLLFSVTWDFGPRNGNCNNIK